MIRVSPGARSRPDRAGDPLDGLVNMFDIGIVLAVAFLIAALTSLHLEGALTDGSSQGSPVTVQPGQTSGPVPPDSGQVIGDGSKVGSVYRLSDGTLVYVTDATPAPTSSPTP